MASTDLYEQFKPTERLTLVLEAMARGDDAEADKLVMSCPRKTYTMADAAYGDRMEASSDVVAVALVDLKTAGGKLSVLHGLLDDLAQLDRWHHVNASLAFMDGVRYARGKPSLDEDEGPAEEDDPEDDQAEEAAAEAMEIGKTPEEAIATLVRIRDDEEFGRRIEAVKAWSQRVSDRSQRVLAEAAQAVAQGLLEVWEGLARFSRSRLGVEGRVLMEAWWPQAMQAIDQVMRRYDQLKPAEEAVAEYAGLLEKLWDRRFGEK